MNEEELEQRVRDAVAAETEPVRVDEYASLASIRERVAASRRRRLVGATALGAAAALVIGVAIGVSVGRDDGGTDITAGGGPTTTIADDCASTTTSAPSRTVVEDNGTTMVVPPDITADGCQDTVPSTEPPATPATDTVVTVVPSTTIPSGLETVYPFNGLGLPGQGDDDPATVAAAFLEAIGADHPGLGAFQSTGPETGTIAVHPVDGNGQVRTDITRTVLHMVRSNGQWTIQRATSESIVPGEAHVAGHTLTVTGSGRGFEATLHVQVIGHGDVDFHEGAIAMASGDIELRPFTAEVDISGSTGQVATVVISNEGGEDGAPSDIVAFTFQLP
jgi:hypothetical protein